MSNYSATSAATYPHDEKSGDNDEEDDDHPKVVDTDPTGRFERFEESLGVGAYKEVFKAFDQEEGVEVAWCQLRLHFSKKKDAEKIQREIEILQSLRCENIINFYASWLKKGPDGKERVFFVTELMTSGTLKQYLRKTKLKPKVLKTWARQILKGLDYLHTREPPIIHRDLKCDNIFINGNNGQAKIGDLGLAIIKNKDHASSVLGTPEFMAPELYEEKYNEKVDIYAFGMCVLELVTKEYPYAECTNQAQIYRKVTTGIKPQALQKVKDPATLEFIELCLRYNPDERPSAGELLKHEFLKEACVDQSGGSVNGGTVPRSVTLSPPKSPTSQQAGSASLPKISSSFSLSNKNLMPPPFTTKTIDSENKTYQVSSATFPPSTTTSNGNSKSNKSEENVQSITNLPGNQTLSRQTPMQCNVAIYKPTEKERQSNKFKPAENEVLLAMTIVVPDRTDVEIKFPFNLCDDTPEDVVAEMVREQILSQEGHDLAKKNIEDIVNKILSGELSIKTQSMDDDSEHLNGSTRGSRAPSVARSDYDSSHETDDELGQKIKASRANGDLSSSFHSEMSLSSSSENVNGIQPCFLKDMSSSSESLTHASSAKTSWEREDNEVRRVLHNAELLKNTTAIVDSTDESIAAIGLPPSIDTQPILDRAGSRPLTTTASPVVARPAQLSSRVRSASISALSNSNGAPPLSPSTFNRSGTTTPFQWPESLSTHPGNLQLPSTEKELHNTDLKMPPSPRNTFSRPLSVASDANGLWNDSYQSSVHNTNQGLTRSQTAPITESNMENSAFTPASPNPSFYNPESPRANYGRSVSFPGSHSPGAPPTKLQDWQRRMSNPVSSTPIQPDTSSSLTNGYSTTHVERVRRSSISSTTSHSSAHSATKEAGSELAIDTRALISQQRQDNQQRVPQEEMTDLGAGLGIQTEHGYTSKFRHGTSNSSSTSFFPGVSLPPSVLQGVTSIPSSSTVSPTENYSSHGLPESQHHYPPSFGLNYGTITYQGEPPTYAGEVDTSDDDEDANTLLALREKQQREVEELQKKHTREWVKLMGERKQKYKSHHQSKSSVNVPKSPASSPKMNRPSTEHNNTQINGLPSLTSTPSLGPQINTSDHDNLGTIPRINSMPHVPNLSVASSASFSSSSPALPIIPKSMTPTSVENTAGLNGLNGRQPLTTSTSSSHSISTKNQLSSINTISLLPTAATIPSSHLPLSLPSTAVPNNPLSSATSSSSISSLQILTSQTMSQHQQQDTISSSALTPTNTLPLRTLTPSIIKSDPDGLIAEMSERQLAELQNLAKHNGQAKSGSLVNGTATYASVVSNSKIQSGRESPVDLSASRHSSTNSNSSNITKLSLNEMEKQKRILSQNNILSTMTNNSQISQTAASIYSPVHPQQSHSINPSAGSLSNKSQNQNTHDLLG
ncbi:4251_t:CDS:2 [Ambispora gerdemannii]|uniref:4251_t:CDS:1 n=1 Tax=Ambispora gerdemannii TaxID=144530 RepID=A0A9N9F407_9GLOM|nr:4251_t:CDS:2 [Ambispora gerdemannii]